MFICDFADVQALELNAWPDLKGFYRSGWRVRLADGFTGRANSVTALIAGADLRDADLMDIEAFYQRRGLPTTIRITKFAADGVDARLAGLGYAMHNPSEFRIATLVDTGPVDPVVSIASQPPQGWVEAFGRLNGRSDFRVETMSAMIDHIVLPAGFAVLIEDGKVQALGMGVVDRTLMEIQSIVVDPSCRGRGLGRRIVASLMTWGRNTGARQAILSVAANNAAAIGLYQSLGFAKFDGYHYRVKLGPCSV
jgi:ribosomal protein S18 acetylase RimI-like enzyme